ncbi:CobQ/CobB/MinD/ParA nucleotide binding domain-containing protein [Actinopolyspora mzabensis]|uniref:CobQ/CobB/MinD/ParA nucleotide binding domain-containing protein n=1 Tax=Actinopolyspora mzabensis TaxID=995066 RepID=A0A1G8YTE6_ACTMZ|nr:cellulose synthase operon protein YhjQ/BcsQ [Actinopolyspora mzabensis]SDK05355.1 CobQ/CobB/MinD/ParA nucleotide binding domain-containing protein [Actinopolyspora mzabensis]
MNEPLPAPNILGALWRYRLSSLGIVLGTVLVSVLVALTVGSAGVAEARIVLKAPDSAQALGFEVTSESGFVRYVNQRALFVTSDRTLGAARKRLGGQETIKELREAVTAKASDNGDSILVRVDIGDAERSTEIANAVVTAYQRESKAEVSAAADEALQALRNRREQLVADVAESGSGVDAASSRTISELDQRITEIRIASDQFGDGVSFVDRAVTDSSGVITALLRDALVGFAVGVLLAATVAWARADRNRRVRDAADLARLSDEPLLGEVEALGEGETARLHNLVVPPLGSYRLVSSVLRNTVRGGLVAVTGVSAGDGATTTVLQVAGAAARDGLRVLVVDAAVRTRELSHNVALQNDWYGMAPIATGAATVHASTRVIEVGPGIEFRVIPAGRASEGAPDYFRSSLLRRAMVEARGGYDLVLVDLPPLESAPEVSALVPAADGVVLTVRKERSVAALRRARERIELLGGKIAGYVFTFASQSSPTTAQPTEQQGEAQGRVSATTVHRGGQ